MLRLIPLIALCLSTSLPAAPGLPGEIDTIAFGSCLRQDREAPILEQIVKAKPDVFIWLGDNVYADSDDPAVVKAKYDKLGAIESFRHLKSAVPFLYVWDDHDYGLNDAGAEYAFKEQNKKLMLDFFGEPQASERRSREGNYDARVIGPEGRRVQFILLDTRTFRSPLKSETRDGKKHYVPTDDPNATVLGEVQWKWLEAQLEQPAEVRIIASSIQVMPTLHRFEKWSNFPKERQRLIETLKPHAASTVIISGDRHHGSVHKLDGLLELTSSSLNQPLDPGPDDKTEPTLQGDPVGRSNFGLIKIKWNPGAAPAIDGSLVSLE